ncbi:MAG: sulfite dehydrogenase [Pseudomonadota bacterium]
MSRDDREPMSAVKRRTLLLGSATSAAGLLGMSVKGAPPEDQGKARVNAQGEKVDPTRVQGAGPSALGARSDFENVERRPVAGIASLTPIEKLQGTLTPSDLHFERHHAGIPKIDPDHHELLLHGLVERPLKWNLRELKRFPSVTRICFIECSGNYFPRAGDRSPPHLVCGLTSQSEWTGVPLATLLREAGVKRAASWLIAEGSDAALMSRSVPLDKALDDALVVYAQNGEALRPAQGYPVRLLLPGWEGNANVKWLRRLEVTDMPAMTRDETSKYTEPMLNGTVRQFSFAVDARSVITYPAYPANIELGWHEIRGLAWSGRGRITRVEVSTDGGSTWQDASLQGPVLAKAHTRFGLPWRWNGQATEIMSRATDDTGYVQPTLKAILAERGPGSAPYHFNPITGWQVRRDGELRFSPTG